MKILENRTSFHTTPKVCLWALNTLLKTEMQLPLLQYVKLFIIIVVSLSIANIGVEVSVHP